MKTMRRRLLAAVALAALVIVAVANTTTTGTFTYRGTVSHVVDGDTLDVQVKTSGFG